MKLKEIEEKAKSDKNVLRLKVMHDLGDKIVYSYVYKTGDIVNEGSFTVYVVNRGLEDEEVYFVGGLPPFMVTTPEPHPLEKRRDEVISKCGLTLVESYTINTVGNFAVIYGYVFVSDRYIGRKLIARIIDDMIVIGEVQ
ncbi:MAG: hypothetical protein QXR84_09455 [Candidatus Bathyarchaeia archaeon]